MSTQTRSSNHPVSYSLLFIKSFSTNTLQQDGSEFYPARAQWPPRSSTLPRRPPRNYSTSPAPPQQTHTRAHSVSPAPIVFLPNGSTNVPNDSSSPYVMYNSTTTSSRNQSPSLTNSSASHLDSSGYLTGMSLPPTECRSRHTKSPSHKEREGHQRQPSNHSSPQKTVSYKPPPSGSPSHVYIKEQRRKQVSQERISGSPNKKVSKSLESSSSRNSSLSPVRKPKSRHTSEDSSKQQRTSNLPTEDGSNRNYLPQSDTRTISPMNNIKKILASPQKPEGLKNNVLHSSLSNIAKGSASNLTSKNMGYKEVNKCDKKLYSEEPNVSEQKGSPKMQKRKLKLSLPLSSPLSGNPKELKNEMDNRNIAMKEESQSVKTYPSLSELNLNFSSLAAQKILQGVSMNSLDTLVEVNLLSEKKKQICKDGVTNTDFGFV